MFGPTTEVTQALIGSLDLEGIDPYENWEKTTRPSGASAEPLWQPVYVEILADAAGSHAGSAQVLLGQIATLARNRGRGPGPPVFTRACRR